MNSQAPFVTPDAEQQALATRALLAGYLRAARSALAATDDTPQGKVHEFRKKMKRVRAGIRLLDDADGLNLRAIEYTCRDLARRLSALRDLDVMIEFLACPSGTAAWPPVLSDVLQAQRQVELDRGVLERPAIEEMMAALSQVEEAVITLPVEHLSEDDLRGALQKSHRRARKLLKRVRGDGADEDVHQFRKRAKRELYQRELLSTVMGFRHPRRTEQLRALCELLGQQQDIAVLTGKAGETGCLAPLLDEWLRNQRDRGLASIVHQGGSVYR